MSKEEVICNLCGESCMLGDDGFKTNGGLIKASICGKYNSTPGNGHGALDDMSEYKFSLCEFCLDWLFEIGKVPPVVFDRNDRTKDTFIPARERIQRDDWRAMKEEFYDEYNRRNEIRKGLADMLTLKRVMRS